MKKVLIILFTLVSGLAFAQTPTSPQQLTTNSAWYESSTGMRWFFNNQYGLNWWRPLQFRDTTNLVATRNYVNQINGNYYTKTQSDARFLPINNPTFIGSLRSISSNLIHPEWYNSSQFLLSRHGVINVTLQSASPSSGGAGVYLIDSTAMPDSRAAGINYTYGNFKISSFLDNGNFKDSLLWVNKNGNVFSKGNIFQNGNQVANDNAVVHKTGDEAISGNKTFNDSLIVKGNTKVGLLEASDIIYAGITDPLSAYSYMSTNGFIHRVQSTGASIDISANGIYGDGGIPTKGYQLGSALMYIKEGGAGGGVSLNGTTSEFFSDAGLKLIAGNGHIKLSHDPTESDDAVTLNYANNNLAPLTSVVFPSNQVLRGSGTGITSDSTNVFNGSLGIGRQPEANSGTIANVYNKANTGNVASNAGVVIESANRNANYILRYPSTGVGGMLWTSNDRATTYAQMAAFPNSGTPYLDLAATGIANASARLFGDKSIILGGTTATTSFGANTIAFGGHSLPTTDNTFTLGTVSKRFNNIYATAATFTNTNISETYSNLSPTGVAVPHILTVTGLGDNTTFKGVAGLQINATDDATVISGTKGVLYGLNVNIIPKIARGNSPFDDAVGVTIQNGSTNGSTATEAIYVGHNSGFTSGAQEFGNGIAINANVFSGLSLNGTTAYGLNAFNGTISGAAVYTKNNVVIARSRNAANSANIDLLKLDGSDNLLLNGTAATLNSAGGFKATTFYSGLSTPGVNMPSTAQMYLNNTGSAYATSYYPNAVFSRPNSTTTHSSWIGSNNSNQAVWVSNNQNLIVGSEVSGTVNPIATFNRSADGYGLTLMNGTPGAPTTLGLLNFRSDGSLHYGDGSADRVVANLAGTQTLTNKTIAAVSNDITSTANRAAQFNSSTGNLEASSVTNTELGYLSGVTSAIQTQINAKGSGTVTSFGKVDGYGITSSVANSTTTPVHTIAADTTSSTGLLSKTRAAANYATIGQLNGKQDALSGTGFVKISGSTISYDNSIYPKSIFSGLGSGDILMYNGTNWYNAGLFVTSPLSYSGGSFTIQQATTSQNGYLSSTDWNTFNGKASNPMTAPGDIIYGGTSGVPTRLAGNITTTPKFLASTGTGSAANAPAYIDIFNSSNTWSFNNDFTGGISSTIYGYKLRWDNASTYIHTILPASNPTADRNIYLPDKSGTVALTSDITALVDNILSKSANYTIAPGDFATGKKTTLDLYVDASSGNITITLPSASTFAGYTIFVTKTDASANTVTINTVLGNNTLLDQYQSRQFNSNASNWFNH